MSEFYRFPAMVGLRKWTIEQQLEKSREETSEIEEAYEEFRHISPYTAPEVAEYFRWHLGMEIVDRMHSDETALRILFSYEEVEQLRDAVEVKNRKKGYYDER